ncbi:hypothetical protein RAM80_05380 [Pseudomonas sp. App30]|uniref:hypothetical protein n=1 Tax=Pseudomonas sp. App30 TaxID=3068990 RepID=UPI003A7FD17F
MKRQFKTAPNLPYSVGVSVGHIWRALLKTQEWVMQAPQLSLLPLSIRRGIVMIAKATLFVLLIAVTFFISILYFGLLTFGRMPLAPTPDPQPGINELNHPMHQYYYPELYDEFGDLR